MWMRPAHTMRHGKFPQTPLTNRSGFRDEGWAGIEALFATALPFSSMYYSVYPSFLAGSSR